MKSLKKVLVLLVLALSIFSFVKIGNRDHKLEFNKKEHNITKILKKQRFECRPSANYLFYVEADIIEKSKTTNKINAQVYVYNRIDKKTYLLANQNLTNQHHNFIDTNTKTVSIDSIYSILPNGDKILDTTFKGVYSFNQLIKYEPIYSSYLRATKKLIL